MHSRTLAPSPQKAIHRHLQTSRQLYCSCAAPFTFKEPWAQLLAVSTSMDSVKNCGGVCGGLTVFTISKHTLLWHYYNDYCSRIQLLPDWHLKCSLGYFRTWQVCIYVYGYVCWYTLCISVSVYMCVWVCVCSGCFSLYSHRHSLGTSGLSARWSYSTLFFILEIT